MYHTIARKILILLSLIGFLNYTVNASLAICRDDPFSAVVLKTQQDISSIASCQILNASLLINAEGESSMDLSPLITLQQITGYLAIIHSPIISNLSAFRNLEVLGQDLYQNTYGVAILDNDDLEDPSIGLCWADQIDWSLITSHPHIVSGNAQNCSSCHQQCQYCWIGQDSRACQVCQHAETGYNFSLASACTSECPLGTLMHPNSTLCPTCDFPNTSTFCWENLVPVFNENEVRAQTINRQAIQLSWFQPYDPNGLILEYIIYRDGNPVLTFPNVFGYDGFGQREWNRYDVGLETYTFHSYYIQAINYFGAGDSYNVSAWTLPDVPAVVSAVEITFTNSTSAVMSWNYSMNPQVTGFRFDWNEESPTVMGPSEIEPDKWVMYLYDLQIGETYTGKLWTLAPIRVESATSLHVVIDIPVLPPTWTSDQLTVITPPLPNGSTEVHLTWSPFEGQSNAFVKYQYQYREFNHSDLHTDQHPLEFDQNLVVIGNLTPDTRYEFRLQLESDLGFGNYSDWETSWTDVGPPDDPCPPVILGFNRETQTLSLLLKSSSNHNGHVTTFLEYDTMVFNTPAYSIEVPTNNTTNTTIEIAINASLWLRTKVQTDPYWAKTSDVIRWVYPNETIVVDQGGSSHNLWDYWYFWLILGLVLLAFIIMIGFLCARCKNKKNRKTHPDVHFEPTDAFKNPLYHNPTGNATNSLNNPSYTTDWDMVEMDGTSTIASGQYGFPPDFYSELNGATMSSKLRQPTTSTYNTLERQKKGTYIDVQDRSNFSALKDQASNAGMVPKNMVEHY